MPYFLQKDASKILRISRDTLLALEKNCDIPETKRLNNGYRYYFKEDIITIAKFKYKENWDKIIDIVALNKGDN